MRRLVPLLALASLLSFPSIVASQPYLALAGTAEDGAPGAVDVAIDEVRVPGLEKSVRLRVDAFAVPHVFALNEHDAMYMLGYLHAQDRLFQMDTLRRTFSGTLAELVGDAALASDVQLRTLGLRRAAEASLAAYSADGQAWLEAYAEGVNDYLADTSKPLPPEYGALELTRASIPAWTAVDSLVIAKGLAFGLSFDLSDIDLTVALGTFAATGAVLGFDGAALFAEDTYRSAPFDDAVSIPGFLSSLGGAAEAGAKARSPFDARAVELAREYREKAAAVPLLERALRPSWDRRGSNWWIAAGAVTDTGVPILANDPHLGLDTPSIFYEAQIRVAPGEDEPMNAFGVTFPGIPSVVLGCNVIACWGATTNPMDVTDVYLEELVIDPQSGLPVATLFEGEPEPLVFVPQTFLVNVLDGQPDTLVDAGVGPLDGGVTLIVPRRNHGPIVDVDLGAEGAVGLSVQYTGWGATRELDAFRGFLRAYDVERFEAAVQLFDVGSQNFAYADVRGDVAYFTSAEMPLREDLQLLGYPDGGIPPFLIRDGTHALRHEWLPALEPDPNRSLPYEILPAEEMPHVVNPAAGYVINANNDPVGTTIDNDPLNQFRPPAGQNGLYYLSPGYAAGFRAGRIEREIGRLLATGDGKLSADEMRALQANHQLLDAEVLVPYLLRAFENAGEPDASPLLAGFGADPELAEAIARLAAWDFSTPTGIEEGYDPGDDPASLPAPSAAEVDASVAATIYSVWRGQIVPQVIDRTLASVGLGDFAPGSSTAVAALRHHLDRFPEREGFGASGLDFFAFPGATSREEARDLVLLECLRAALDLLASPTFEPAFGGSGDQDDYRWGLLHRIVFEHPLGGPFDVPPAGGLTSVAPDLPGVARSGGFGAVDASSHSARADGVHEFMFGSGPARRFVGVMEPGGPAADEVIPGGQVGIVGHPHYASQLPLWLTNAYHPFPYRPDAVVEATETFRLFLPDAP